MSRAEARAGRSWDAMRPFKSAFMLMTISLCVILSLFLLDWVLRAQNFPVRNVRFEGEFRHVTHAELERAVMDTVRGNFFLLDLDAVKARVESLPWVQRASVRRAWPWDVYVRFSEQRLVARWGDAAWLNDAGEVVKVQGDESVSDLPLLAGPAGTSIQVLAHYLAFRRILQHARLDLKRVVLTARRAWELGLADGVVLVVDRDRPERKLERFAQVYARTLARETRSVGRVDLRYTNGFAVQWKDKQMASDVSKRVRRAAAGATSDPANEG